MKKHFVQIILLVFSLIKTYGQSGLPPAFDIIEDTSLYTEIPPGNWKMLEDKEGKLTFQQVIQTPVADEFHFNQSKDIRFDYTMQTYWFCYHLRNTMSHDVEIGFGYDISHNQGNEESIYYLYKDEKWIKFENGLIAPQRKLKGLVLNNYIPVLMKPGEELIVYNRVHNSNLFSQFSSNNHSVVFSASRKIMEQNYVQDESLYIDAVHNSVLFGILLFASFFNFFFFLIVKERVYLFFALYVLFLGIGRMYLETYFVFLSGSHFFWGLLYPVVYGVTFFLLAFFVRSLLDTRMLMPRWDYFLNRISYSVLFINFLDCLSPYLFSSLIGPDSYRKIDVIWFILSVILMACILVTFFIYLKRRDSENVMVIRLILPAFCIWTVCWAIETSYGFFGIVSFSLKFTIWVRNWWNIIESICLFWLVLSFSWFLLQRFRKLQNTIFKQAIEKEKEKTALQQKTSEMEMRSLHAQMNPHFIFNALNSIKAMILLQDTQNASRYLSRFAQLIRLNLEHSTKTFLSLRQNMEYLERYLEMEQLRFADFNFQIDIRGDLDVDEIRIAPMMLQPLVENAIWHGLLPSAMEKKVTILFYLDSEGLVCEIEDNGIGLSQSLQMKNVSLAIHESVGIENIRHRIAILNEKYDIHCSLSIFDKKETEGPDHQGTIARLFVPQFSEHFISQNFIP